MLRDAESNRLYRRINIKIIFPENSIPNQRFSRRADPKKGFGPEAVDDVLMQVTNRLDILYPWWNFELVELAPSGRSANFIFNFSGYQPRPTSSVAPVNEEVQSTPHDAPEVKFVE